MRKGQSVVLAAMVIGLLFVLVGTSTVAEEEQSIPDEIIIDNKGYKPDRKGPVRFSHLSHIEDYEVSCDQCHHEYQDGKNVWKKGDPVKKCISCHSPLKSKGKVKKLSTAFHRNCKTCHRRALREDISEEAPFKSCYDCHERKP